MSPTTEHRERAEAYREANKSRPCFVCNAFAVLVIIVLVTSLVFGFIENAERKAGERKRTQ